MKPVKLVLMSVILGMVFSAVVFAEGKRLLPDLVVSRGTFLATDAAWSSDDKIVVTIVLEIENRKGGADAGAFQLSIMHQYPPPAAPMETELEFTGARLFTGLEAGSSIHVSGQISFSKSQAGQTAKVRAIVDSMNQVKESNERNNVSDWLEIQLPLERMKPAVTVPVPLKRFK